MDIKAKLNSPKLFFIMTCVIAVYHARIDAGCVSFLDSYISTTINNIIEMSAVVAMNFFFFRSGFYLIHNYSNKDYIHKIKRRFNSLLIPYILWQLIAIIIVKFNSSNIYIYIIDVLSSVFLINLKLPNAPLWYLYALFLLSLLTPFFSFLIKNFNRIMLCGLFLLYSFVFKVGINGFLSNSAIGYFTNALIYFPVFFVGMYYSTTKDNVSSLIFVIFSNFFQIINGSFMNLFLCALTFIIIRFFPTTNKRLKIYNCSFLIYCTHFIIINLFGVKVFTFIKPIFGYNFICNLFTRFSILSLIILFSYLFTTICGNICPSVLKILTGNRGILNNHK